MVNGSALLFCILAEFDSLRLDAQKGGKERKGMRKKKKKEWKQKKRKKKLKLHD